MKYFTVSDGAVKPGAIGRSFAIALGLIAGAAMMPAQAQAPAKTQPAAAAKKTAKVSKQGHWFKLCEKTKEGKTAFCLVIQEIRDIRSGQVVSSVSIRQVPGKQEDMIITVPVGMLLPPGVQVVIDKEKPEKLRYTMCSPAVCWAMRPATADLIAKLKKGAQVAVMAIHPKGKKVAVPFSLAGFTRAYDGAPTEPEVYKKKIQESIEIIRKRAAEMKKKADEKKAKSAAGNAAPAPGKSAPAPKK